MTPFYPAFHLLVMPKESNLSKAMQWLGLTYSGYFNQRHQRSGPLFQGRFKSFIVEEGDYLKRLICYVHRNPVRAGIVERLADYHWSSYPCLGYRRRCLPWLQTDKASRATGSRSDQPVKPTARRKAAFSRICDMGFCLGENEWRQNSERLLQANRTKTDLKSDNS